MNRTANLSTCFSTMGLAAVLLLAAAGCNSGDVEAKSAPVAPVATSTVTKGEPTAARMIARSTERWKLVEKQNWIECYEYLTPEQRRNMTVGQYIQGKPIHEYTNARIGEVLKIEKDQGYLRVSSLWTPHHPALAKVKLDPGQSLTQDIDMIENWRFVDGDWYYVRAMKEPDFFEKHPEMLKQAPSDLIAGPKADSKPEAK